MDPANLYKSQKAPQFFTQYLPWFIMILGIFVILSTFQSYGITWDEMVQNNYAKMVLKYYSSFFQDESCNTYKNLYLYGPLFELICTVVYSTTGFAEYETRHFLIACSAFLAVIALYKTGRLFEHRFVGLFAILMLVFLPQFYGHSFNNSKDIPFACAFCWSMYFICKIHTGENQKISSYLFCALSIGITLTLRIGGFLLLCFFLASQTIAYFTFYQKSCARGKFILSTGKNFFLVLGLSWLIMIIFWPWTHKAPISRPLEAFFSAVHFQEIYVTIFEGKHFYSNELPRYYLSKYILITTPPLTLLFFLIGLYASLRKILFSYRSKDSFLFQMALLWLFFPILFVAVSRSNLYDGMRHFLFVLPPLAIIAACGIAYTMDLLVAYTKQTRFAVPLFLLLPLFPLVDYIQLHPYQSTYFNFFAGGTSRAWLDYETDYWLSSYKEAAEWINERAKEQKDRKFVVLLVANKSSRLCAEYYLLPNVELHSFTQKSEPIPMVFDYYIATTRLGMHNNFPELPIVHAIGRQGAIYCVIKKWE
ncbi:MAG: glycosyltransferase family 39 protein [Candidatus Brocadiae bacterium]|nr:glycosyltransferase family 39 protein [Candidatus Brocadiia bacterium]